MLKCDLVDWVIRRVLLVLRTIRFTLLAPKRLNLWLCGRIVREVLHPRRRVPRRLVVFRVFITIVTTVVLVTFMIVRISMKIFLCAVRWPPAMERVLSSSITHKHK